MRGLHEELENERQSAACYKKTIQEIKEKISMNEADIQQELAEETVLAQIQYTREQHNSIVHCLKQELHNVLQNPSNCCKKAKIDNAEKYITMI